MLFNLLLQTEKDYIKVREISPRCGTLIPFQTCGYTLCPFLLHISLMHVFGFQNIYMHRVTLKRRIVCSEICIVNMIAP